MGERLEKFGEAWWRVKPYFLWLLAVLAVAGAIWALIYVPKMQVPICPPGKEGLPPKICFDIENEARRTLAYILAGILAIIGIYMGHRRIRALERQVQIGQEQLQVAQEGQITERFTRAIEQLGSDKMEIRLGGIYALERIANDSDKDYWPIMETLTAYVRENAAFGDQTQDEKGGNAGEETITPDSSAIPASDAFSKPDTDIQAILAVLGRRKYRYGQGENQRLGLRRTDLNWATLWEAHLEGAVLQGACLAGANLIEAHLEGADLWGATGLTQKQLANAILDEKTIFPAYLRKPPTQDKGSQRN